MGRKKGGRNADTPIKDLEALEQKKLGKSGKEIQEALNISKNTVTKRIQRAIGMPQIQDFIQRSIDRNAMMLSKCDLKLNEILDGTDHPFQGVQLRAIENVYQTFGVWKREPVIQVNNFTPIILKVGEEIVQIDVGASSETSSSLQK